ncbi:MULTISPECIES: transporter substrate-binding domain-containing protein [Agrobacterium]|uniref:transporter substrate-binding domain-containing protein n=1 Tax=Agrobacterium TaxID=357 RepID=UPI0022B8140B|nr:MULTISPECIES: transporter substrate-binding domain-containing protein [Agrobacterium]MCZ7888589.1 transporter substrate-binding domain-containing protein [Agrobacterium salinitolerans]MDA5630944.1 transporter substrate-binding domain-containing protein [Agrobacterium sp. ST15.16.055]MDA6981831.1 transporter substrate-binding domain-containing protein [Agrobacterium salinitolerans]
MNRRDFGRVMLLAGAAALLPSSALLAATEGATLEAIRARGTLRIGVFAGTEPYYHKNLATGEWEGFCVAMGRDLAQHIGVKLELVETTWGNSVIDLQSNKIDIMFGLSNNPERAKVVDFTKALMDNTFTLVARKDLEVTKWEEMNRPEMRVAVDLGSTQDNFARKNLPNCTLVALKSADETILALQSGRADAIIQVALLAVVTTKNLAPNVKLIIPGPHASQPTTIGVRRDPNGEFRDYVATWLAERREQGKISNWIVESLALVGVDKAALPANLTF